MRILSFQILSSALLSSYELARATEFLSSTRDNLLEALRGLSDSQWHFEPGVACWSVAEILEHVVLIEDRVHAIVGEMKDAPAAEPDRVNSEVDEIIFAEVPRRTSKVKAPPQFSPARRWSPVEALARFRESRNRSLKLLMEAPHLRGRLLPHPLFGAWDGYQWIVAAAAHCARHTHQIIEVKASACFPRTGALSIH